MLRILLLICFLPLALISNESIFLNNNLKQAATGDYAVIAQGKSYTLFHIFDKKDNLITIEEVTIPASTACQIITSWPAWIKNNAPQNTSWVHYQINLTNNEILNSYSFTKQKWFTIQEADNFLGTLLKLELYPVPLEYRRRVGSKRNTQIDNRPLWQPKMVVNGHIQEGVDFDAYMTTWPNDGGALSGKSIELYFPQDRGAYPGYFPYWLQTKGVFGPAKVRIVDSGKGLYSPKRWQ